MAVLAVNAFGRFGSFLFEDHCVPENFAIGGAQAEGVQGSVRLGVLLLSVLDDGGGEIQFSPDQNGRRPAFAGGLDEPSNVFGLGPFRGKIFRGYMSVAGRAAENRPILRLGAGTDQKGGKRKEKFHGTQY